MAPAVGSPLFDLVTGFPPDDAVDVLLPLPTTLAVWMTVLESTGHAADVAALRRAHVDEARATVRRIQALADVLAGAPEAGPAVLRTTHLIEERVRGVSGLRPHLHVFVGARVRHPDGHETPVDVDELAARVADDVVPDHRDRLVAATTAACGLVWGTTAWSPCELVEPAWLLDRAARAEADEPTCPGPWPRRQVLPGGRRTVLPPAGPHYGVDP
jgi:hypothetical protein